MTSTRLTLRQVRMEQLAFWRNPDHAFFTFALPLVLLVLLGTVNQGDRLEERGIDAVTLFVPGIVVFGVIAAAYANLATRIAVLRGEGVLKRIRATPLSPSLYLAGHLGSAISTALLGAGLTVALGWSLFGVAPRANAAPQLVAGLSLGIVCFAALALAVSTIIPSADAAGPITNATYLPIALISGVFDPNLQLPSGLTTVVGMLPVKALADVLQASFDSTRSTASIADLAVLATWAVVGVILARRYFRWQPR
jgi:ABC-2 type transport system permease protein